MYLLKKFSKQLIQLFMFSVLVFTLQAQDAKVQEAPQRPKFSSNLHDVNITAVDNVVMLSFALLKSVDDISLKVQVIEDQLHGSIPDASLLLTQIDDCTNAVNTVSITSPELANNVANMICNIKDLHIPVLKIPIVLKNLNEARKAVQYCMSYSKYLVTSIIPTMKNINQKTVADSTVAKANNK